MEPVAYRQIFEETVVYTKSTSAGCPTITQTSTYIPVCPSMQIVNTLNQYLIPSGVVMPFLEAGWTRYESADQEISFGVLLEAGTQIWIPVL